MATYSFLTRSELVQMLISKESELDKQKLKAEPSDATQKKTWNDIKAKLAQDIQAIEKQLKDTMPKSDPPRGGGGAVVPSEHDQVMVKSLQDQATVQNLLDVIKNVPKMATGDSMERFVAEMDQIYEVEVKDQLTDLPKLEDEFTRATKRLLTNVMYSQMSKSGDDTSTWAHLKKYLITNHGSKITMFQHLSRLWNLEPKPEEKLTDFGAKLEEQVHTASIHIMKLFTKNHTPAGQEAVQMSAEDVFKLVGAMLASIQVKKNHEEIFKAMIKKMDTHWTASSLVADAQDYVDRLGSTNNITKTGAEVAFIAKSKNPKSSDQKKSSGKKQTEDDSTKAFKELQKQIEANSKALQSLTLTNTSNQTGGRSGPSKYFNESAEWKGKVNYKKPPHLQICWKHLEGHCTRPKCPRRHVDVHTARAAYEEAVKDEALSDQPQQLNSLFQLGPDMK